MKEVRMRSDSPNRENSLTKHKKNLKFQEENEHERHLRKNQI